MILKVLVTIIFKGLQGENEAAHQLVDRAVACFSKNSLARIEWKALRLKAAAFIKKRKAFKSSSSSS